MRDLEKIRIICDTMNNTRLDQMQCYNCPIHWDNGNPQSNKCAINYYAGDEVVATILDDMMFDD